MLIIGAHAAGSYKDNCESEAAPLDEDLSPERPPPKKAKAAAQKPAVVKKAAPAKKLAAAEAAVVAESPPDPSHRPRPGRAAAKAAALWTSTVMRMEVTLGTTIKLRWSCAG